MGVGKSHSRVNFSALKKNYFDSIRRLFITNSLALTSL
jgi:hypothetical protein